MTKNKNSDYSWLKKGLVYLKPVFASIRDAVFITDTQGNIILANPSVEILTGIISTDLLGSKIQEVIKINSEKITPRFFFEEALGGWRAVELGEAATLSQAQGKKIPITANATPIYDSGGGYAGVVFVIRDISEEVLRKHEQYEFLSFVSHQFRQPLGALSWGIEAITENPNLTEEDGETLKDLQKVISRFKNFINDLIDLSRLNKGEMTLKHDPINIREVVENVCREMRGLAESQNVRLNLFSNAQPLEKFIVPGDRDRLNDVFSNLISNSIFYNKPRGEVRIEAEFVENKFLEQLALKKHGGAGFHDYLRRSLEKKVRSFLLVTIFDNGLGIPENSQPKIFESFFRGDNVIKKGIAGTGLGLFIVKAIVERLGGRIFFESEENTGTKFYVILKNE